MFQNQQYASGVALTNKQAESGCAELSESAARIVEALDAAKLDAESKTKAKHEARKVLVGIYYLLHLAPEQGLRTLRPAWNVLRSWGNVLEAALGDSSLDLTPAELAAGPQLVNALHYRPR